MLQVSLDSSKLLGIGVAEIGGGAGTAAGGAFDAGTFGAGAFREDRFWPWAGIVAAPVNIPANINATMPFAKRNFISIPFVRQIKKAGACLTQAPAFYEAFKCLLPAELEAAARANFSAVCTDTDTASQISVGAEPCRKRGRASNAVLVITKSARYAEFGVWSKHW